MSSLSPKDQSRFQALLEKHQLVEVRDLILGSAVECVHVLLGNAEEDHVVGVSRSGGLPDLPPNVPWPRAGDRFLNFLMQINLADIPPLGDNPLPAEGLLLFFLEDDEHCRKVRCRVLFVPEIAEVKQAAAPPEAKLARLEYGGLTAHRLRLASAVDLPGQGSPLYEQVKERAPRTALGAGRDRFLRLVEESGLEEGTSDCVGQLFGVAQTPGGDLRLHAHLSRSNLFECLYDPDYLEANKTELAKKAEEWLLLWRIDSCDEVGVSIWDNGSLSLLIRAADLAKRDFAHVYAEIVTR